MGIAPCCDSTGKKNQLDYNKNNDNYISSSSKNYSLNIDKNDPILASSTNNIQSQTPVVPTNQSILRNSATSLKTNETLTTPNTPSINNSIKNINQQSPFRCIKSFTAHDNKIVSLIELYNGLIATGSYDSTIKIWDINSQQCLKVMNESGNVLCLLEFFPGKILSGTDENVINLWDINNSYNQSLYTFDGHLLWVNCLVKCDERYFASGSNDSDIRIWSYQDRECVNVLKGHNNCVLSMVLLRDGNLCSGSADLSIKIWDWVNGNCLQTLNGHKKWVKCVYQLSNGYIISGSDDKTIKIWNNYNCIGDLNGHLRSVRSFCQISDNLFASASFDKTIKIWDINTMKMFHSVSDKLYLLRREISPFHYPVISFMAYDSFRAFVCAMSFSVRRMRSPLLIICLARPQTSALCSFSCCRSSGVISLREISILSPSTF